MRNSQRLFPGRADPPSPMLYTGPPSSMHLPRDLVTTPAAPVGPFLLARHRSGHEDTKQWGPGGLSAQFIGARTGQETDMVTGEQGHPVRASLPRCGRLLFCTGAGGGAGGVSRDQPDSVWGGSPLSAPLGGRPHCHPVLHPKTTTAVGFSPRWVGTRGRHPGFNAKLPN